MTDFRPHYAHSTASDLWRQESERHGMEVDRRERAMRNGDGMWGLARTGEATPKPQGSFPSFEMDWWERGGKELYLDDTNKPRE